MRQRGFAIISAIFILVVLAALAGFVVSTTTVQNITFAQDIQGARALQAARAGAEWSAFQWLNSGTCGDTTKTFAGTTLSDFSATVTATSYTLSGATVTFCRIVSNAKSSGSPGSIGYVERELLTIVEK